jgi:TatD DNase family protein
MVLFDTHAHLDDDRFRDDLPAVLDRATAAGVSRVICVATTAADSARCVEIAGRFPTVWASVGIQPNHVVEVKAGDWETIERLAAAPRVVALGETGLDRHWDFTPFPQQEDYFARHLALSRRTGLPVIIHCREAEADVVRMLHGDFDRHGPVSGVMHSFTGDAPTAAACLQMGLYVSFAGMVTYKTAADLRSVAATVPADRLLVETDCPYLAPMPVRGRRNEPAYVAHTAALLAQVRGVDVDDLAAQTTRNALELFGYIKASGVA